MGTDATTAASCTFLDGHPLVDTNHMEESAGGPDLTVGVLPHSGKTTLVEVGGLCPDMPHDDDERMTT
jgi:exosome complex component RRP41